jgi:APA family basic amino acid/polyamine antiporter
VQNSLTILKVGIICVFVLAALWAGRGDTAHLTQRIGWAELFSGKLAVSLIFVSFAYSGWNAAAYLGGEILSPQRNLPLALITGTLVVTVLYMALNLVFLYALPPDAMSGTLDVGTKAAAALFGTTAGYWVGGAIALGLLSVLSAMIMTGPRVYFAMARDGVFFETFGRLSKLHRTPAASIFLQAGIAMVMVLTATFDQLLIYIGFTLSLSALMTVGGLVILRRRQPLAQGQYRALGYPVTPALFIAGNAWIIFYALKSRPIASLLGVLTIGLGLAVYWAFQRKAIDAETLQR